MIETLTDLLMITPSECLEEGARGAALFKATDADIEDSRPNPDYKKHGTEELVPYSMLPDFN